MQGVFCTKKIATQVTHLARLIEFVVNCGLHHVFFSSVISASSHAIEEKSLSVKLNGQRSIHDILKPVNSCIISVTMISYTIGFT